MKLFSVKFVGMLFLMLTSNSIFSQETFKQAFLDEFKALTQEEQIIRIKEGINLNAKYLWNEDEPYNVEELTSTFYHLIAHNYGFYGMDENKKVVYQMIISSKEPLENPFFWLIDASGDRGSDILEYFYLLHKYNHKVTEDQFKKVYSFYYGKEDINKQNIEGRTPLIYAAILGYDDLVEEYLTNGADAKLKDKADKTALDYCITKKSKKLLKKHK